MKRNMTNKAIFSFLFGGGWTSQGIVTEGSCLWKMGDRGMRRIERETKAKKLTRPEESCEEKDNWHEEEERIKRRKQDGGRCFAAVGRTTAGSHHFRLRSSFYHVMNPTNVWKSCCLFFGVNQLIFGQTWVLNLELVSCMYVFSNVVIIDLTPYLIRNLIFTYRILFNLKTTRHICILIWYERITF